MAQKCTVCVHPETKQIEDDIVQGLPNTQIADKFGLDHQSVRYHSIHHLPDKLIHAVRKEETAHAENILTGIKNLLTRTKSILDKAEDKGQNRLALEAIKEARSSYELLSKIAVKLEEYRRQDQVQEEDGVREQVMEGLKVLTDAELKTYLALQSKIYAAREDYQLEPGERYLVESVALSWDGTVGGFNQTNNQDDQSQKSRQTRLPQDKNTHKQDSTTVPDQPEPEFEELEDFDLELDDLDLSEPKWLAKWREENAGGPI